jgi:hypothetical protein
LRTLHSADPKNKNPADLSIDGVLNNLAERVTAKYHSAPLHPNPRTPFNINALRSNAARISLQYSGTIRHPLIG